ncbi:MAG: YaiO family outer membrane beta-barrel protein [Methanoregulaceae archaeon]|nr:YaiO family outer membrane beta-barrel protein [Methanoregulaceae archaeon]
MPTTLHSLHDSCLVGLLRLFPKSLLFVLATAVTFSATTTFSQELLYRPADIRAPSRYEAYLRYFYEHYSYYDDATNGVAAAIVYRDLAKWTLFAEPVYQRKFGFDEGFLSLGAAYKFDSQTSLMETIGFSMGNGTFPDFMTDTEVVHPFTRWLALHLGYRLSIFEDVNVHAVYGGTTIYPRNDLYLLVKVYEVFSAFKEPAKTDATTSVQVKIGGLPNDANEVALFYARNAYSFISIEDIGNIRANTYGMIWNFDLSRNWGIVSAFSYEDREKPYSGNQFRLDIGLRFKL